MQALVERRQSSRFGGDDRKIRCGVSMFAGVHWPALIFLAVSKANDLGNAWSYGFFWSPFERLSIKRKGVSWDHRPAINETAFQCLPLFQRFSESKTSNSADRICKLTMICAQSNGILWSYTCSPSHRTRFGSERRTLCLPL